MLVNKHLTFGRQSGAASWFIFVFDSILYLILFALAAKNHHPNSNEFDFGLSVSCLSIETGCCLFYFYAIIMHQMSSSK